MPVVGHVTLPASLPTSPTAVPRINPFDAFDAALDMTQEEAMALAKGQRRAVKAIAKACEHELQQFKNKRPGQLHPEELDAIARRLMDKKKCLIVIGGLPLSNTPPTPGFARSARSTALLAGAAVTRIAALAPTAVAAAADTVVSAALVPVVGVMAASELAASGCLAGASLEPAVLAPPAALVGCGVGAAAGGVLGAVRQALAVPLASLRRGSMARKTLGALDPYPVARAHAERKEMSTYRIAVITSESIDQLAARLQYKRLVWEANLPREASEG